MAKGNGVKLVKIQVDGELVDAKECTSCFKTKPLYDYHAKKSSVGGRAPNCKVCRSRQENERYRTKNPVIMKHYRWKQDEIIQWIKSSYENGDDISVTAVKRRYPGMTRACEKRFGGWKHMVELAGIDYGEVSKVRFWNGTDIIDEIKKIYREDGRINQGYVFGYRKGFISTALKHFGSWENAVESAGLTFADIKEDRHIAQDCGKMFEGVLEELLIETGSAYKCYSKTTRIGLVPDFTNGNQWLDAKFSEWSMNIHATRSKYEPHCKLLTIVFMRGTNDRDEMVSDKTRVMSVHKWIKQLPKYRQTYYNDKLTEIENKLVVSGIS